MFDGGKVTEFEQNGNVFYIRPLDPFTSLKLLGDLQKLVSPIIGNVFSAMGNKSGSEEEQEKISVMDKNIDVGAVEKAFAALAEHVDGQKLESMAMRILDKNYVSISIDGADTTRLDKPQINELFTGNVSDMLMLIVEVLKANYGDFTKLFNALSGNVAALKRAK